MANPPSRKPLRKPLVLVVDDEPKNLQVVGSLLRDRGYEIVFTTRGEEALNLAFDHLPDLILLDIMMPQMDGFEICERLKKAPALAKIPVIFLTAKSETEDIVRAFGAGGVDYVVKPFRPEELLARVRTHIQLRQLKGLIPICAYCKKIRNDGDYWEEIEQYIHAHTGSDFSHGICPACYAEMAKKWEPSGSAKPS